MIGACIILCSSEGLDKLGKSSSRLYHTTHFPGLMMLSLLLETCNTGVSVTILPRAQQRSGLPSFLSTDCPFFFPLWLWGSWRSFSFISGWSHSPISALRVSVVPPSLPEVLIAMAFPAGRLTLGAWSVREVPQPAGQFPAWQGSSMSCSFCEKSKRPFSHVCRLSLSTPLSHL